MAEVQCKARTCSNPAVPLSPDIIQPKQAVGDDGKLVPVVPAP